MTAHDVRLRLGRLAAERLEAIQAGLGHNAVYMRELEQDSAPRARPHRPRRHGNRHTAWPARRPAARLISTSAGGACRGGSTVGEAMTDSPHIADLRADARYARERYDLYRAKVYGPRPTSLARLRELEREHETAQARLLHAEQEQQASGKG